MKTFRKSTLISSVALLLVAIVALSGATFAWFSSKSAASVTGINAKTEQSSNLTVSKIATGEWTQNLGLNTTNKLVPVTPYVYDAEGDKPAVDAETGKALKVTDLSEAEWFTASARGFDEQTAYTDTEGASPYSDAATANYIKQRVYVKWQETDTTKTKDLKVDLTATAANNSSKTQDFYRAAVVPVVATSSDTDFVTIENRAQSIYSFDAYTPAEGATYGYYDVTTSGTDIALGTIKAGSVYAFDIYVWFEGEDAQCIDSNSTNDITLNVDFK